MVFLFIFFIIIFLILTSNIRIEMKSIEFSSEKKAHLNKNYTILIKWCILKALPILKIKINEQKFKKWNVEKSIKKSIDKMEIQLIVNKNQFDKEFFEIAKASFKNLNLEICRLNLEAEYATEDATITAFVLPVISSILTLWLKKQEEKNKELTPYYFKIQPIFQNKNFIKFRISGVFNLKIIHIISTICVIKKKMKAEKHRRIYHRSHYDYGKEKNLIKMMYK